MEKFIELARKSLGLTLKRMRTTAHLSQARIGAELATDQTAVSRIEAGLQGLECWQLQRLAHIYNVKVDNILTGEVNYWQIAELFKRTPPFPERYRQYPYSRVREVLPTILFMKSIKGSQYAERTLSGFGLDTALMQGGEQTIGANCNLDLLRFLVSEGILTPKSFGSLIEQTRNLKVHEPLNEIYRAQSSEFRLLKMFVMNSHQYESNFSYNITDIRKASFDVAVAPKDHMRFLSYKDGILGDLICRYKKQYLAEFPKYIGKSPVQIEEVECHFHGAPKCVYEIKIA